jgi:hypothetical protein
MNTRKRRYCSGFVLFQSFGFMFVLFVLAVSALTIAVLHSKNNQKESCLGFQKKIQIHVRAYQVKNDLSPGDTIDWSKIKTTLDSSCPSGGKYVFSENIPTDGFQACLCEDGIHKPSSTKGW